MVECERAGKKRKGRQGEVNETHRRARSRWEKREKRRLTFVVGGVVDAEISVPDDGQLHGKAAHLHPAVEVLSPWQPQGSEKRGDKTCKRL